MDLAEISRPRESSASDAAGDGGTDPWRGIARVKDLVNHESALVPLKMI